MDTENNIKNETECPETVPEEQTGMTKEEQEWALKKEPRPPVPRYVFAVIAAIIIIAFLGGSFWYYRTNVLPEKYYQDATVLFKQEKFAEACSLYEKVYKLRPKRKGVLYQIAFCLEKTGRIDEALARYEEHIKLMPTDGKALLRAGWLYSEKGSYKKGLPLLKNGAKKLKDPYAWTLLGNAAVKFGDRDTAVEALSKQVELFKEPEQILTCSKMLMDLKAWKEAIDGYNSFTKLVPDDKRGIHGTNAAKIMLGYPIDQKFTIIPGLSIGYVKLDATKEEVKAAIGKPDSKEFTTVGGKSLLADSSVEIWTYGNSMPKRGLRIIFLSGKVKEVETRSSEYKTENGVGISNFLLKKNEDKLEWRKEAKTSAVLCLIKGGGLTFYAADLNEDGTDAKYKKLRLHKGTYSIDNVNGISLINIFE